MEHKTPTSSLFIAQQGTPTSTPSELHYPVGAFYRSEISLLQRLFNLPLYPDQTNVTRENTRSQVRYTLLPLTEILGFGPAKKQEQEPRMLNQQKDTEDARPQQVTRPALQTLVLATKNHIKFELPGTRTPNCPIKSRELYH